jgi:hypothetical protein
MANNCNVMVANPGEVSDKMFQIALWSIGHMFGKSDSSNFPQLLCFCNGMFSPFIRVVLVADG